MDNELEKIKEMRALLNTANRLRTLLPRYQEVISSSNCDKHDLAFGCDGRFSVFKVDTSLDCYTGYFGSSGCSTFAHVDQKHAYRFLRAALNKNLKLILDDMASFAEAEAAQLKVQAEKEVETFRKTLEESISMQ